MANIQHSTLTGSSLHEPKGADTATVNTVYVSDGAGSGLWKKAEGEDTVGSFDNSAAANATNGKVLMANGSGGSTWEFPDVHETGWSDLFGSFISAKLTGSNQPTWTQVKTDGAGSVGVYGYGFSATILNELWLAFHINHDYKTGTPFFPHIHWLPTDTGTGTVRWGIEWTSCPGHNQAAFGNTQFTYIEEAAPGIAYQHVVSEVPDPGITVPNAEPDMIILARIFRDAAHANDTYTGVAIGLQLDAHFQVERHSTPNKTPPFV